MGYSPRISDLVASTDEEWGDPEENQKGIVYYGIPRIDNALYGMNTRRGEIIAIQAMKKNRKTTCAINILYNVALQFRKRGVWLCADTMESGMPPEAYRDVMIAMSATRKLIADVFGKDRKNWPPYHDLVNHPDIENEIGISKEFLLYNKRTRRQHDAIEWAKTNLSKLPILLFGASPTQGKARNLKLSMQRWDMLYNGDHPQAKGCLVRLFTADHLQQYPGESDYKKLEEVVNVYSEFVTSHPGTIVIAISQVSLTSAREARQGFGKMTAKGGDKLGAECNVLFTTRYDRVAAPHEVTIEVTETRRRPPPAVVQEIEPNSGVFLRPARLAEGEW